MNKVIATLLCFILLLQLSTIALATDGDPNIDGGGGGTGSGTGTNKWTPGNDGVRVTVVRESDNYSVTSPVDFTNVHTPNINLYLGKKSKISYASGQSISPQLGESYLWINPATPMPTVVSSGGAVNIAAVKKYFGTEGTLRDICAKTGFDFEKLTTSGDYVIMLEPLVYITYNGIRFCMTATEAALYNRMTSGDLRAKLGNITSQNLPLAMFLEKPDLGFPAWGGATSGIRSDGEIISSLGIGTVRFKGGACCNHQLDCPCITDPENPSDCECKKNHPDEECGPDNPSCDCEPADDPNNPAEGTKYYDYHTDTDVITTIEVKDTAGGKSGISPDDSARILFNIDGDTYSKPFVTPPHDSTEIWIKWHTPKKAKRISISVSTSHGRVITPTVIANVTELTEETPPDPNSRDTNKGFSVPRLPNETSVTRTTWGEWIPKWHENWVWESDMDFVSSGHDNSCSDSCTSEHGSWVDHGEYVDHGWWVYTRKEYYATASAKTAIKPAEQVPTAVQKAYGWEMRSGYGINLSVDAKVYTNGKNGDITTAQNAVVTFPEFQYESYNRVMELTDSNEFSLRENVYSMYKAPVHFTPIWYPDDAEYAPQTKVIDIWTPGGQMFVYGDDALTIRDGTYFDDWHIAPKLVRE